jgi:hypothetical protein
MATHVQNKHSRRATNDDQSSLSRATASSKLDQILCCTQHIEKRIAHVEEDMRNLKRVTNTNSQRFARMQK